LRFALTLSEISVETMRCNLRHAHPDATDERIKELLYAWLPHRNPTEFTAISVLPGLTPSAARRGHLIAIKIMIASHQRPLDRCGIVGLVELNIPEDLELARTTLAEVQAQGLAGPRDLVAELDDYIRVAAEPDPTFRPRAVLPEPLP
jgi:hypothetical protein